MASSLDNPEAMALLALVYSTDQFGSLEIEKSVTLMLKAARLGNEYAASLYSRQYLMWMQNVSNRRGYLEQLASVPEGQNIAVNTYIVGGLCSFYSYGENPTSKEWREIAAEKKVLNPNEVRQWCRVLAEASVPSAARNVLYSYYFDSAQDWESIAYWAERTSLIAARKTSLKAYFSEITREMESVKIEARNKLPAQVYLRSIQRACDATRGVEC